MIVRISNLLALPPLQGKSQADSSARLFCFQPEPGLPERGDENKKATSSAIALRGFSLLSTLQRITPNIVRCNPINDLTLNPSPGVEGLDSAYMVRGEDFLNAAWLGYSLLNTLKEDHELK